MGKLVAKTAAALLVVLVSNSFASCLRIKHSGPQARAGTIVDGFNFVLDGYGLRELPASVICCCLTKGPKVCHLKTKVMHYSPRSFPTFQDGWKGSREEAVGAVWPSSALPSRTPFFTSLASSQHGGLSQAFQGWKAETKDPSRFSYVSDTIAQLPHSAYESESDSV